MNLLKRIQIKAKRVTNPEDLEACSHIILPGVGHFDHAMKRLNASGLRPMLEKLVLKDKIPLIGVCVGMQMLSDGSEEGVLPGLGWIPGKVLNMKNSSSFKKIKSM